MDGKSDFKYVLAKPQGQEPELAAPDPRGHAQTEQMTGSGAKGILNKIKKKL